MIRSAVSVLAIVAIFVGCGGGDSVLTFDKTLDPCEEDLPPACGTAPRCLLNASHYVNGKFPGGRQFVVHTKGAAKLNIQIQLTQQRSPGTDLVVKVFESDCSNTYSWDSAGRDLFRIADQDGIIIIPIDVSREGDHPITLTTDAYSGYTLAVEVIGASSS